MTNMKNKTETFASDIGQLTDGLPEHVEDARVAAEQTWRAAIRFAQSNPAVCLVGAFVVGFALAKVARYA